MPLPGTRMIPAGWSAHHRLAAAATMTGECAITVTAGEGTLGENGVWHPAATTTPYDGPCRVQARPTSERVVVTAGQAETVRTYAAAIRADAPDIPAGAVLTVTASPDAHLVGKALLIVDVAYGTEAWQVNLVCEERTPSTP